MTVHRYTLDVDVPRVSSMVDREKLKQQLIKHEGLRLFPYVDTVDKITIGIGRNLTDRGVSSVIAHQMLDEDIDRCIKELSGYAWFTCLNEVRQRALVDMVFNLGLTKFLTFTHLIAALTAGDYDEAAHQMIESRWATQVGIRANELANMIIKG